MNIGFIGCGNMACAMIGGLIGAKIVKNDEIYGSDLNPSTLEKVKEEFGIRTSRDNAGIAGKCDIVILSVKPQFYPSVIREIKDAVTDATLIISIAPGKTLRALEDLFDRPVRLVRTMPNTPALVGQGMTAMCANERVDDRDLQHARAIFQSFGKVEEVSEYMMDAVVAVSGSSPAYVFMMIEAMADAAVLKGMPRQMAYTFAAQSVFGAAKMVLELKKHPGELKDMVTSPAGTTIEAVKVLEKEGFRSAIMEAMIACAERSSKL